jgi:arylsulfatase A
MEEYLVFDTARLIKHISVLKAHFWFALWFCFLFTSCSTPVPEKSQPNIILIMADDLGFETIGANGGRSYQTPNIDQLAGQGMRFEHCYAQPLCTPSRIQIMTGIYNVRNYVRFGLLDEGQTTFGHLLQQAGYSTCIVGKWQLGKDPMSPRRAGFDEHCLWQVTKGREDSAGRDTRFLNPVLETNGETQEYGDHQYGPDIVSQYGLDFIEKSAKSNQPFFLYYPMILTHCPFSATPDSPEYFSDDTTILKYKGQPQYFEDMVSYMDKIVGNIIAKLGELGISENTILIFTGDNGTDVPIVSEFRDRQVAGAKGQSTDGGTRVPLVVRWPGVIEAGTISQELVDFTDFLPTICDVVGSRADDSLKIDGHSFLPQLLGGKSHPREWIYSWYSRSGEVNEARIFARTQRYKLYETGEFYDVPNDFLEENPIDVDLLDPATLDIYHKLEDVIIQYGGRRGENLN